jgi:hypothetical protein
MPLPDLVLLSLEKIYDPQIRADIHRALQWWATEDRQAESTLAALAQVGAGVSTLLDIVALSPLVPGIISEWAAAAATPANVGMRSTDNLLDRTLAWLVRRHRRHGRITYETREHYKHIVRALAKAHLRSD